MFLFNTVVNRPHHVLMRPVILFVACIAASSVANSKTLVFQSTNDPSPEQVVSVAPNAAGSAAATPAKQFSTQSQAASANSELFFMLEQLQQEVRYLRGMLEEQENQIHHLRETGKSRYRDIDSRVLDISKQLSNLAAPSQAPVSVGAAPQVSSEYQGVVPVSPKANTLNETNRASTAAPPSEAQRREYQQAYSLIKEKKFDEAIKKFHLFIERYPEGDLTGNAYYWLGEVYLVIPQLEQAKQAFSVVVSAFPDHRKAPDALFKLGVSYDRLQDPAKSEQYLNDVQLKYPESTAAKLAKSYKINR